MSRTGTRSLWAQGVLLGACFLGSGGILLAAAVHHNDFGAVFDPRLERLGDPKDSIPAFLPLAWLLSICRLAAWSVFPLAFVALLVGVAALIRTRQARERGMFAGVLVVTAVWTVVAGVALSPYGRNLQNWLLD
jgi:hypothetical protein